MQRIFSRLAVLAVAVALLVIPVSVQAAPTQADSDSVTASVWTTFQSWLQSTWDQFEITFAPEPVEDETSSTESETEPETGTDARHTLDPGG